MFRTRLSQWFARCLAKNESMERVIKASVGFHHHLFHFFFFFFHFYFPHNLFYIPKQNQPPFIWESFIAILMCSKQNTMSLSCKIWLVFLITFVRFWEWNVVSCLFLSSSCQHFRHRLPTQTLSLGPMATPCCSLWYWKKKRKKGQSTFWCSSPPNSAQNQFHTRHKTRFSSKSNLRPLIRSVNELWCCFAGKTICISLVSTRWAANLPGGTPHVLLPGVAARLPTSSRVLLSTCRNVRQLQFKAFHIFPSTSQVSFVNPKYYTQSLRFLWKRPVAIPLDISKARACVVKPQSKQEKKQAAWWWVFWSPSGGKIHNKPSAPCERTKCSSNLSSTGWDVHVDDAAVWSLWPGMKISRFTSLEDVVIKPLRSERGIHRALGCTPCCPPTSHSHSIEHQVHDNTMPFLFQIMLFLQLTQKENLCTSLLRTKKHTQSTWRRFQHLSWRYWMTALASLHCSMQCLPPNSTRPENR